GIDPLDVRRMKETHPRQARRVEQIMAYPTRFLSTILIGNTMVNVAISGVILPIAILIHEKQNALIAMVLQLFLLLIFGEIGPKRIAATYPQKVAALYSSLLQFFIVVLTPLRRMIDLVTSSFAHLFKPHGRTITEEEFETVVDLSLEAGVLDEDESDMVKGIIRLEDLKASDVMTPRVDILGIDLDDREQDVLQLVRNAKVRHVLVYQDQLDHVVGCLDVRRFLLDPDHRIKDALRMPFFIPEACPLNKLLAQFLSENKRAAVVVDEYGGTAGLVTRGDVLEEIVGDVDDERGSHELLFNQLGPNRWLMDGRMSLENISEELDIEFEEEGVDRISGWITARLERLPKPGDICETDRFKLIARQMRRNRLTLVELMIKRNAE
ncbi:MAG: hemolysin family protein, partial [Verrucomicrobiota bacterium]